MKNYRGMTISDVIMQNALLDRMSSEEKDYYIIALTDKLRSFHAITVAMEKEDAFPEIGELMRKALNQ